MTTISLITPKRLLLIAAVTALALAIAAAAPALSRAAAQTYCVHQAGSTCPVGSVDEGKNLQTALDDAANNPSTPTAPNAITIGPGTYEPSPAGSGFSANSQYPLQVTGSGVGQTSLTDSGAQSVIALAGASRNTVSLSGLTVGGSAGCGVLITNGSVDHVAVVPSGPGSSTETGILFTFSTIKDSTVTLPADSSAWGLLIDGGDFSTNEIDDVTVDGGSYGVAAEFGVVIHRARLTGSTYSIAADSAPVYIDDSLLVGGGVAAFDEHGSEGSVQAVNDTIAAGAGAHTGVFAVSISGAGSAVTIYNSIVHGFPTSFDANGANATIAAANDNYDGATEESGSTLSVSGRVMGDPGFIAPSAGDYRLAWNSPLIDAGDTGLVSATSSATDLGGNPREVRSSTGSSSPLDVGAYEYQHRAPTAVASATPTSAAIGTAIAFTSRASDPDDGDTLTYAWSFDDGATATGATVTHAFTTPGAHTATLTVTDPTGLTAKQTTAVMVTSAAAPQTTTTPLPNGPTTSPAPPPSGPTTSPASPHLVVLGKPSVNGNTVTLKLSCTGITACAGVNVAETTITTKARRQIVQVASVRLSINPGQTKTVTLTLNAKGKSLLARSGKLPVTITVTMATAGSTTVITTAHTTLHPPKKPSHHHP